MRDIYDAIRVGFYDFEDLRPKPFITLSEEEISRINKSIESIYNRSDLSDREKNIVVKYLKFLLKRNENIGCEKIKILTDIDEIKKSINAIKKDKRYYPNNNLIGLLGSDPWFSYVADPVKFIDTNRYGRYVRIVYSGGTGVAIAIKIKPDNRFLLNLMYRHSIGGYSLEIPGTITKEDESIKDSIIRCIETETGFTQDKISKIVFLGNYISDRGILGEVVPTLYVEIECAIDEKNLIKDEGIKDHILLKFSEWKNYSVAGFFVNKKIIYTCNDGYSRNALFLMEAKGIDNI